LNIACTFPLDVIVAPPKYESGKYSPLQPVRSSRVNLATKERLRSMNFITYLAAAAGSPAAAIRALNVKRSCIYTGLEG
jgi:hypothetical protein